MADRFDIEQELGDRVIKLLGLQPLEYSYPKIENPDECYPDPDKTYEMHMSICDSDFYDGLDLDSDLDAALDRVVLAGPRWFGWNIGFWVNKGEWRVKLVDPTWRDIFKVANRAYLDGGCVDHHFLEGFRYDKSKGFNRFFFGS